MSNTAFNVGTTSWTHKNSQHNFRNFFKNNKTLVTFLNVFVFIAVIAITIACNKKIQELLQEHVWNYFSGFQFSAWFSHILSYSVFELMATFKFDEIAKKDNLFSNYQITLFCGFIVLTIDMFFLICDFFEKRKTLHKHKLAFGVFIHPDLEKWSRGVLKSLIDCAFFVLKVLLFWSFLTISIFDSLQANSIFQHNFFFSVLQFAFVTWIFVSGLIAYNFYSWYREYYLHFTQLPKYKLKKESPNFLLTKSFIELLLSAFALIMITISLPYDLLLIYLFLKHFSITVNKKIRSSHIKEKLIY